MKDMSDTSSDFSVLLCSDYLPPYPGGVEVVVEKLSTQLADQNVDVTIFTLDSGDEPQLVNSDRIRVHRASTIDLTEVIGLQSQFSPASFTELHSLIETVDPDIVHIHNRFFFTSLTTATLNALNQIDAPLIATLHLGKLDEVGGLSGLVARVYEQTVARAIFSQCDRIITVSEAVANHAQSIGISSDSISVVPNGVDPNEFSPSSKTDSGPSVLFVGRLIQNKGPQILLEAAPKVINSCPETEFSFVGTGPLEESLQSRAQELGISENVHFKGYVESVAVEMKSADVFCRPSTSEGMPLTLLEAMASALPAVVTPVAGVPEIVEDGQSGILVPTEDPDSTADNIITLLKNPFLRETIGTTARDYVVQEHSWDRRTERIKQIYQSLVGGV